MLESTAWLFSVIAFICLRVNFQTFLVPPRLSWGFWWCVADAVMSSHSVAGFDDTLRRHRQCINGSLKGWYWMRSGEGKYSTADMYRARLLWKRCCWSFWKQQCRKWWEFSKRSRWEFTELCYFAVVNFIALFIVYLLYFTQVYLFLVWASKDLLV